MNIYKKPEMFVEIGDSVVIENKKTNVVLFGTAIRISEDPESPEYDLVTLRFEKPVSEVFSDDDELYLSKVYKT